MATIKVVWKDSGKPRSHVRVSVQGSGFLSGMSTKHTDSNGRVVFEGIQRGEVFLEGDSQGTFKFQDEVIFET